MYRAVTNVVAKRFQAGDQEGSGEAKSFKPLAPAPS